jgi:tetratricopeptide (TPR) repeat protein
LNFVQILERARSRNADVETIASLAEIALDSQREKEALSIIEESARRHRDNATLWQWTGLLHRALDDRATAIAAFEMAARLKPQDRLIAHTRARLHLEAGLPASSLFESALTVAPSDGGVILGLGAARLAEGNGLFAVTELERVVSQNPNWIDGHRDLIQLRNLLLGKENSLVSLDRALRLQPKNEALWQLLIEVQIQMESYESVLSTVAHARAAMGSVQFLEIGEAVALSETGSVSKADLAFERCLASEDPSLIVHQVRHALRNGRLELSLSLIDAGLEKSRDRALWPYASIAWRLSGDARANWLDASSGLVSVVDLSDQLPPLDRLADILRALHRARHPHMDQSVRGGTQTDGALLGRLEPEIRTLRAVLSKAVKAHIQQLPRPDSRHPTLAFRRDTEPRFSGSWSVHLRGKGYHTNHVHPAGWISSALYISLPEADGEAGWLTLGSPQTCLGLDIPPTQRIEPKLGRLVLFPSTMWHGTLPFASGERLTVAFDVQPPTAY